MVESEVFQIDERESQNLDIKINIQNPLKSCKNQKRRGCYLKSKRINSFIKNVEDIDIDPTSIP